MSFALRIFGITNREAQRRAKLARFLIQHYKLKDMKVIVTESRKVNRAITLNGKTHNLTLHMMLHTYPTFEFEVIEKITNEAGAKVIGAWQHGRSGGKVHYEPIEFDKREGANLKWFGPVVNYQNGRKKDSCKYLLDIVEH
jgi:hypothetical protein